MDKAEWSGWKILARNQTKDYVFIMMRRSYIPPLMDSFVDIAIILEGPKQVSGIFKSENLEFKDTQETI